jgi:tyrosyl-tRNA synthetase
MEGVPQAIISKDAYTTCNSIIDLLSETTGCSIFPSKGEARKMIQGGGVSINKSKVEDGTAKPAFDLLHSKYLLAQKGKKNYYLIILE